MYVQNSRPANNKIFDLSFSDYNFSHLMNKLKIFIRWTLNNKTE